MKTIKQLGLSLIVLTILANRISVAEAREVELSRPTAMETLGTYEPDIEPGVPPGPGSGSRYER